MKKKILLVLSVVVSMNIYSQELPFSAVINKLKNDQKSFEQFRYLGELNCLENRLESKEKKLIVLEYGSLFNHMKALPRLINRQSLIRAFNLFEKDKNHKHINIFEECFHIYNSDGAKKFYMSFVEDEKNYFNKENDEYFDEEEVYQNMLDYLNMGKIDRCRFLDCMPQK